MEHQSERTVYIRIEYVGEPSADIQDDAKWNESEMLSFHTGDIQWKGFLAHMNYGTLTLIGNNEITNEKWLVVRNTLNPSGEEVYTVDDVQNWLKTLKQSKEK